MTKSLPLSLAAVAACWSTTPAEMVSADDSFAAGSSLTAIDDGYPSNDLLLADQAALSNGTTPQAFAAVIPAASVTRR